MNFILIQLQKGRNAIYSCSPSQYAINRPHSKHFFFLTKQVQTIRDLGNYHKQTARRRTADDSMVLVFVCTGAFSYQCHFPSTDFSWKKNISEKVTCRQDHDRETLQHGLIMLMSFTGGLPSATSGQTLEQAFLERGHPHGQAVRLDDH